MMKAIPHPPTFTTFFTEIPASDFCNPNSKSGGGKKKLTELTKGETDAQENHKFSKTLSAPDATKMCVLVLGLQTNKTQSSSE
jgi:hypothetical protein